VFDDFAQQVYIKVVYLNHSKVMFAVNLKNTFICLYIYNARMHNYLYMSVASCWRKKIFRHILENVLSLATSIWFQIFKIFLHKLYTEKTFERGVKNLVSHAFCSSLINFDEFFYGIYEIWIFACEKCLLKIIKCWNDPIFAIKKNPKNIDFCRTLLEEVE
jgi:hypothetical protein